MLVRGITKCSKATAKMEQTLKKDVLKCNLFSVNSKEIPPFITRSHMRNHCSTPRCKQDKSGASQRRQIWKGLSGHPRSCHKVYLNWWLWVEDEGIQAFPEQSLQQEHELQTCCSDHCERNSTRENS